MTDYSSNTTVYVNVARIAYVRDYVSDGAHAAIYFTDDHGLRIKETLDILMDKITAALV